MNLSKMLGHKKSEIIFTGVYVYNKDLIYIRAQLISLNKKNIDHTLVIRFKEGEWGQYIIEAPSISHCVITENYHPKVLVLIPDGTLHIASQSGFSFEFIEGKNQKPNSLKNIVYITQINKKFYAVGMGRMIYKSNDASKWITFDSGVKEISHKDSIGGFKCIDGFSEDHLYIAGFKGEIWRYNNKIWYKIDSPTNLKLEKIICTTTKDVYICGENGIILKGFEDSWIIIEQDLTISTFWDLEEFNDKIYLSTSKSLYSLSNDKLEKVNIGLNRKIDFSYLHSKEGYLWSVGQKNIAQYNGFKWKILF